jgi:hypothetical protein
VAEAIRRIVELGAEGEYCINYVIFAGVIGLFTASAGDDR